jgi:PAS domain S-box-containing protein
VSEWKAAPIPGDEHARLGRLARLTLREGERHDALDHMTALAADLTQVPMALVSIVTADRQVFASRFGLEAGSTGRDVSFCGHALHEPRPFRVEDAFRDPRFAANPLVLGPPHVRSYLGVPLGAEAGQSGLGTLCVIDRAPRAWTTRDEERLAHLAAFVEHYLESLGHRRAWEDSPLSLVILDRRGRCEQVNPALSGLTGRPAAMLQGMPLAATLLPADRAVLTAMIAHTFEHRTSPTRRELRFVRLSGELVSGGVSMSPMRDHDDYLICVIRDISLERSASARTGVIAEVRAELEEPLEDARALLHRLRSEPAADVGQTVDQLARRLDALDGLIDARMGDIGGRMQIEHALRASEARLRALVEHALDLLLVIDDRGRIVDANTVALDALGWTYEALVGSSLRVVLPAFSDSMGKAWFEAAGSGAAPAALGPTLPATRATFVARDGAELRAELRWLAMDWNGPGRLVVLAHDVTATVRRQDRLERERDALEARDQLRSEALRALESAESALQRSLAEKETLLQEIHHRVKNNLQIVASLLVLQIDRLSSAEGRSLLTDSVQRVQSMALIHQLLYGSSSLEHVDVSAYARTLAESLRNVLSPTTRVRFDTEPVEVSVERAAPIGLLLNELLTNAFKYGSASAPGARAEVLVQVRAEGPDLRLVVHDSGQGLPPGFRIDRGTSLGLQLVRSLTRQLRGTIEARSEGGARFELRCRV